MNVPRTGDVPRREPASPAASAHLVGTLVAVGAVDRITALVGVRSVEEEGHLAVERIADRIVVAEVLGTLLEGQIIVVGLHAVAVLETPAAEPRVVAVDLVHRHTAVEVHDVLSGEGLVVGGRNAEIVRHHLVVGPFEDTAARQDRNRYGIRIVRIRIQIRVAVPDGRRLDGPIGDRLVRRLRDVVLLNGG